MIGTSMHINNTSSSSSDHNNFNIAPPFKKQRRQAAGLVVQSFFPGGQAPGAGGGPHGGITKKSTAQPRPKLHVPPRGIGPIAEPNQNDVLCGRGGRINAHEGNVQFRDVINSHKKEYLAKSTKKLQKAHIAARIIEQIRTMDPPGRFLKEDSSTGMWFDIGDAKAIKKAGQALREDAPDIRHEIDSGDEMLQQGGGGGGSTPSKSPVVAKTNPKAAKKSSPKPKSAPSSNVNMMQMPQQQQVQQQPIFLTPQQQAQLDPQQAQAYKQYLLQLQQQAQRQQQQLNNMNSDNMSIGGGSLYNMPTQLYQNVRGFTNKAATKIKGQASALSKQAMEAVGFDEAAAAYNEEAAFGRYFTPTSELAGSEVSGMSSNFSAIDMTGGSAVSGSHVSALSMGSAQFGHQQQQPANINSLRMSSNSGSSKLRNSNVSDLTYNFMSMSGLTRSPSFGDMSGSLGGGGNNNNNGVPMNDASFAAMMQEENNEVNAAMKGWESQKQQSSVRSSTKSSRSRIGNSTMSVASMGSMMSMGSMRSNTSDSTWLKQYSTTDDRSMISDVSGSIVALDLAADLRHLTQI